MARRVLEVEVVGDSSSLKRALGSADDDAGGLKNSLATMDEALQDAEANLGDVQSAIDRFGRSDASAKVTVDTASAEASIGNVKENLSDIRSPEVRLRLQEEGVRAQIAAVEKRLGDLGRKEASPKVSLAMAGAIAQMEKLEAKLAALDAKRVEVKVDVDRSSNSLGLLSKAFSGVGRSTDDSGNRIGIFGRVLDVMSSSVIPGGNALGNILGGGFAKLGGSAGAATPQVAASGGAMAALGPIAGSAGVAIGTTLFVAFGAAASAAVAMTASVGAAALGVGAAGVAAGGAGVAFGALGAGAMLRFKDQANQAGTAANALKTSFEGLQSTFARVTAGGADRVFKGMADGLRAIRPAVASLGPAFTVLGRAVGTAFGSLGRDLGTLGPKMSALIRATAPLAGPIAAGVGALARIFLNIANAAMPFLVAGARQVASALQSWAQGTEGASRLRGVISGLIGHFKSLWNLGKQVANIVLGFFRAAAPAGKGLVDSLGQAAKKFGEWVNSAKGQNAIKKFFDEVVPVIKEMAKVIGTVIVVGVKMFKAMAPAFEGISKVVNGAVKAIGFLLDAFNDLPAPIRAIFYPLAGILGLFSNLSTAAPVLKKAVVGAWNAIKGGVSSAIKAWGDAKGKLSRTWDSLKGLASKAFDTVRGTVKSSIGKGVKAATDAWEKGKGTLTRIWNALPAPVRSALTKVATEVKNRSVAAVKSAGDGWSKIGGVASKAWEKAGPAIKGALTKAVNYVKGMVGDFLGAGKAIIEGLGKGIASAAQGVYDKIADIASKVKAKAKAALSIRSPSMVFFEIGANVSQGMALGISAGASDVTRALDRDVLAPLGKPAPALTRAPGASYGGSAPATSGGATYGNVYMYDTVISSKTQADAMAHKLAFRIATAAV